MRHVFVESNWVFDYAAPGDHKSPKAVELLQHAREGRIQLHLPAFCLLEARQAILTKCQPRNEADAIRGYLLRAKLEGKESSEVDDTVRRVLDQFEQQITSEMKLLDDTIASIRREAGLEVFALNDRMLERSVDLTVLGLSLKPYDQAILAAVLVRAEELRSQGEEDLCFCETDSDLQPWDRDRKAKEPLKSVYDSAGVWVYGNFGMTAPERPKHWPA